MLAEATDMRKVIGDVDVIYHEGLYHLFHLVLPNHDFIAHAVSSNGIHWRRIRNALFIGDPGSWDDLMLWTMHVSPDPHEPGFWRMFYTGLSRREQGNVQRIGLARSADLYRWKKMPTHWEDHRGPNDPPLVQEARRIALQEESNASNALFDKTSNYPLEPDPRFYESALDGQRHWVSFRDPYYFRDGKQGWLLSAARVNEGPLVRRGCVALMEETGPDQFVPYPPLHHPEIYDDIEVPNLVKLKNQYYLIGSIREDAKVRYWFTDKIGHIWATHSDNVLLARGNYAGRVCIDDQGLLLWNFFSYDIHNRTRNNLLLPPKRLNVDEQGRLITTSFERIQDFKREPIDIQHFRMLKSSSGADQVKHRGETALEFKSEGRFQAFVLEQQLDSFEFRGRLELSGDGKCGLIFRVSSETHDGYYLSLDLKKGVAQLRAWGTNFQRKGEDMIKFHPLQEEYWVMNRPSQAEFKLIAFGSYLELSIDNQVLLSLADQKYQSGLLGVYVESASLVLSQPEIHRLESPTQSDQHLAQG